MDKYKGKFANKSAEKFWTDHFPENPEDAKRWGPIVKHYALSMKTLVVAHSRIEGAWKAYAKDVPGFNHDIEAQIVLRHGDQVSEKVALAMFPEFKGVPYAR